jgi:hypothetical protein
MSSSTSLEDRVAALENELAEIKRRMAVQGSGDWFARVAGSFEHEPDFDEVLRLGREMRRSDSPDNSP